jgi:hypothetical protein
MSEETHLLDRYLRFSNEGGTRINVALSAVKPDVDRAFADDPEARDDVRRLNDVQLFLMQVIAFDGFVTKCMHAAGMPPSEARKGSLVCRADRLASPEVKQGDTYKALRSGVKQIARVRNAWAHRLCDEEISDDVRDLTDRFGLHEKDGYLWVDLEHFAADRQQVWGFVVCTLKQMAELIWPCVQARMKSAHTAQP